MFVFLIFGLDITGPLFSMHKEFLFDPLYFQLSEWWKILQLDEYLRQLFWLTIVIYKKYLYKKKNEYMLFNL